MGKEDSIIMVVEKDDLFNDDVFDGFKSHEKVNYIDRILKNYGFMTRKFAENDPTYKQPIAYCIIVNPILKKVFAYQRSKKEEHYSEKRLQGKWSWGIGGHIEKSDVINENPIVDSMLREINEEVEISDIITKLLGYIYHDFGVNAVHFGLLYLVETNSIDVRPKDPEIAEGGFKTIQELEFILNSPDCKVEDWSKTALTPLKDYFRNL